MASWTFWLVLVFMHVQHVSHVICALYQKVDFCEATDTLTSRDTVLWLDCVQLCDQDPQCKMFTREGEICTLYPQPVNEQCHQWTNLTKYFVQQDAACMNGGYLNTDGNCVCVHGFAGTNCSTRMISCSEGYSTGYYNNYDGVLPVHPASSVKPFFVHCDMVNGGRLYVQSHEDPGTNLYQYWTQMTEGFGTLMGDHWLGNRYLHQLLSARDMVFTISYIIDNGTAFTRSYSDFKIKNENGDFAIESFSSTYGDLGSDCLGSLIGIAFSAADSDNDGLGWYSCAVQHSGSWWFDDCELPQFGHTGQPALCNPNSELTPTADGLRKNVPREIFWVDFPFAVTKSSIWLTDSPPPA